MNKEQMEWQFNDDNEFQTYFPFEESNKPRMPYCWDGDCHLLINDKFYRHTPSSGSPKSPSSPNFDIDPTPQYEVMDDYFDSEIKSVVSSEITESTDAGANNEIEVKETKDMTIKAQLDFIMYSGKKGKKNFLKEQKYKRSKKTKEQLDILEYELNDIKNQNIDEEKMDELITKTGLSEKQIYKWLWDHRSQK